MLNIISKSTTLPVTLSDAKAQCRVDFTSDDTYITNLIIRAQDLLERETGVDLSTTVWQWSGHYNSLVDGVLTLERRPLQSVTGINYYDGSNTLQAWDSSNYYVTTGCRTFAQITPYIIWCIVYYLRPDPIQVNYTSGYTTTPPVAAAAILLQVAEWYEQRTTETEARLNKQLINYDRLVALL